MSVDSLGHVINSVFTPLKNRLVKNRLVKKVNPPEKDRKRKDSDEPSFEQEEYSDKKRGQAVTTYNNQCQIEDNSDEENEAGNHPKLDEIG